MSAAEKTSWLTEKLDQGCTKSREVMRAMWNENEYANKGMQRSTNTKPSDVRNTLTIVSICKVVVFFVEIATQHCIIFLLVMSFPHLCPGGLAIISVFALLTKSIEVLLKNKKFIDWKSWCYLVSGSSLMSYSSMVWIVLSCPVVWLLKAPLWSTLTIWSSYFLLHVYAQQFPTSIDSAFLHTIAVGHWPCSIQYSTWKGQL